MLEFKKRFKNCDYRKEYNTIWQIIYTRILQKSDSSLDDMT